MKHLLLSGFLILAILACNKDDEPERGEKKYYFQDSSIILNDSLNRYILSTGSNLVFSFRNSFGENDQVMDNESAVTVSFEIASDVNSFYLKDEQLEQAKVNYFNWSAWFRSSPVPVKKGFVKGTKISDDLWEIEIDVEVESLDLAKVKEKGEFKRMRCGEVKVSLPKIKRLLAILLSL